MKSIEWINWTSKNFAILVWMLLAIKYFSKGIFFLHDINFFRTIDLLIGEILFGCLLAMTILYHIFSRQVLRDRQKEKKK